MTKKHAEVDATKNQIDCLIKLLIIWPTVSNKTAAQYVQDTLNTTMTRSALQEAKRRSGFSIPRYTDATLSKQAFARYAVALFSVKNGILACSEEHLKAFVRKALKTQFGEDTNTVLVDTWVLEYAKEQVGPFASSSLAEAEAELIRLGIEIKSDRKQEELL